MVGYAHPCTVWNDPCHFHQKTMRKKSKDDGWWEKKFKNDRLKNVMQPQQTVFSLHKKKTAHVRGDKM